MAKWWTLVAVCVATFMLLLDITVVNVALPYIERDLNASFEDLQWVIDAYALTLAAFLLTAGSVADGFGRRRVFVLGLVVFTVASALCGLAGSPLVLNLARGLQGVGGGMMFATSLALLASAYAGRDRGTAIGIWGATIGAAVAVGPLVGGVLVEAIGWEAIFFVNLPIGLAAIALTLTRVEESRDPHGGGIDWGGTLTFSAALFLAVFGLGFGMVSQILTVAVQNAVPPRDIGVATGSANLFRALGGSLGVAVFGALLSGNPDLADALHTVFLTAAPIAAAALLVALFLRETPLQRRTA